MRSELDDIDRLLESDDDIVPSSGFAGDVMEAVRAAAEAPPPLRFPWARFMLGVGACLLWAATGLSLLKGVELTLPSLEDASGLGDTWLLLQSGAVVVLATLGIVRLGLPLRGGHQR